MTAGLQSTVVGSVLHLVLDAPERRNALSRTMLRGLAARLRGIDETVTAVVISGSGEAFSAGADFRELTGTGEDITFDDEVAAVTAAIVGAPRVVAAALEGPCIGAAADIALACDIRVAGQGSYVQIPAVRLGLLYNPTALERLGRRFPQDTLRRLLLLGERFPDEQALRAGLVSEVVPRGEAVKRSLERLEDITVAELDALAATKGLLNALERQAYDAVHWAERRRSLLEAPARVTAVDRAKRTHTEKKGPERR
jgi:enoyl-CoA hydratase